MQLIHNGVIYNYVLNLQGDVHQIRRASDGIIVAVYDYNAWGEVLFSSGWMAQHNPLRYRGKYFDNSTGLYYLQSRFYDPVVGRFINADGYVSTGQGILGFNMFTYCLNNPANRIDPTGYRSAAAFREADRLSVAQLRFRQMIARINQRAAERNIRASTSAARANSPVPNLGNANRHFGSTGNTGSNSLATTLMGRVFKEAGIPGASTIISGASTLSSSMDQGFSRGEALFITGMSIAGGVLGAKGGFIGSYIGSYFGREIAIDMINPQPVRQSEHGPFPFWVNEGRHVGG